MSTLDVEGHPMAHASWCINGDVRYIYDAATLGFPGLVIELIANGETIIGELYRFAGRTFGVGDNAIKAWQESRPCS